MYEKGPTKIYDIREIDEGDYGELVRCLVGRLARRV